MTASIYIETAGCAFNASDGEVMAGVLRKSGFTIVPSPEASDLILLNTCTVKDRTFLNFRKRLDELRGKGAGPEDEASPSGSPARPPARTPKPMVVAGCIPKAYEGTDLLRDVSTMGPDQVSRVAEVVRETLRGRLIHATGGDHRSRRLGLPLLRRNPIIEILPIARGCRSACTFCQTRLARGRLSSFSPDEILNQARRALDDGVREFWVTGQDTGAYGYDIDVALPHLLQRLLDLEGDFRVRLGMTSPQWVAQRLEEYLEVFEHPKMFRFIHVPIQSGSDRVLRHMKRDGNVAQLEAIHDAFTARFPDSTFMTDIIVGYPTETEEDFEATLGLLGRLGLPCTNCSKFSPRPGTAAARLAQLPSSTISRRSKRLVALVREIAGRYHRRRIGRRYSVLIDQINADGSRLGRTDAYRPMLLNGDIPLGATIEARVERGEPFRFFGRALEAKSQARGSALI